MRRPPVCIQEKECPVCPVFTTGTNMELKDFPTTINTPEKINVNYVQDKLNKTR
jgi:creatinine amidohydrolase/Fe(II)-dependent formamide hydrolase-like protein